jgi:hypothetical protein
MTQYYKRITGSAIQGTASTVTEPLGTIVVTNDGQLRLHDGSTAGGNAVGGGAPASSLVNGGYTVTLQSEGSLLIPAGDAYNTAKGQIFSDNESSFINLDVQFSSDITGGIRIGTDGPKPVDIVTNTSISNHKWRFGADGILTLPFGSTINDTPNAPGFGNGKAVEIKPGNVINSNQLLRIYATVPNPDANHLHLTSGDLSITDLFLGDDNQFVQIAVDGKVCIGTYGTAGHFWTFGTDGSLALPNGLNNTHSEIYTTNGGYQTVFETFAVKGHGQKLTLDYDDAAVKIQSQLGTEWTFGQTGSLTLPNGSTIGDGNAVFGVPITTARGTILIGNSGEIGQADHFHIMKAGQQNLALFLGDDNNYVKLPSTGGVEISSSEIGGQHYWTFGTDGGLTFPDGATINESKITAAPEQSLNLYGGSTQEGQGKNIQLYGGHAESTSTNSYDGGRVRIYAGQGVNGGAGGYVRLRTYGTDTTNHNLKLDSDGVVYLPYGSQIDFNAPYSRFKDAQNTGVQLGSPNDQNYVNVDNTAVTIQVNSDALLEPQHNWVFDTNGALTLPSGQPILFGNGNSRIQAGMDFHINSEEGISLEAVNVSDPQNPVVSSWYFGTDGRLSLPGALVNANGIEMTTDRGTVQFGYNLEGPGVPEHFHINKSGSFDLFLGDDYNYVKLPDGGGVDISTSGPSRKTWQFGTDGDLTVPGTIKSSTISQVGYQFVVQTGVGGATNNNGASGVSLDHSALVDLIQAGWTAQFANYGPVAVTIVFDYDGLKYIGMGNSGFSANFPITFTSPDYAPAMILPLVVASGSSHWQFGPDGSITLPSGAGFGLGESGQLKTNDGTTLSLDFRDTGGRGFYTNSDGFSLRSNGSNTWKFGTTGSITFPDNTQQTTAWTGVVLPVSQSVPTSSSGKAGDIAGMVAYTTAFLYYCTADYTTGGVQLWQRIAKDATAW